METDIRQVPVGQLTREEFTRLVRAKMIFLRKSYGFNQPEWGKIFKKFLNKGIRGARVEGDHSNVTIEMLWVVCKVYELNPSEFFDFSEIPLKYINPRYGRRK